MPDLVIPRDDWATSAHPPGGDRDPTKKVEIFLHHTVQGNGSFTRKQERATMRGLYDFHVHTRGWADIGYNYVCFPSGRIYRARPKDRVPAAQEGHNTSTRACAVVGTNPVLSLLQRRKLRKLIRKLKQGGFHTLGGHRDVQATECPGNRIYRWVKKWRRDFEMRQP